MIYAMSDLHGCTEKYRKMLKKIKLCDSDVLYILGDVVDRGDGGMEILLDMMARENVIPIIGNHDFTARSILKTLEAQGGGMDREKIKKLIDMWFYDGGNTTLAAYLKLKQADRKKVLTYLDSFLIYDEVKTGGNHYFLSHTVPKKERMLHFDSLLWQEFIAGEAEYEKQYFDDRILVTGHTPTSLIDEKYAGRIYSKNNHLAIDCSAAFGGRLACVCLDTQDMFYI